MYIVCGDDHLCDILYHAYSWPLYSYVSGTAIYLQLCAELHHCTMLIGWLVFHLGFFITPLLEWTYNVFQPSDDPYDLTHQGASVIANFTTHGKSHFYGLPYPSADSLDPMDHFFSFDVSLTIPKNMRKMIHTNFKPISAYIRGFYH